MEEFLCVLFLYSALRHYRCYHGADFQVVNQFFCIFLLFWCRWIVFPFKMHLYILFISFANVFVGHFKARSLSLQAKERVKLRKFAQILMLPAGFLYNF